MTDKSTDTIKQMGNAIWGKDYFSNEHDDLIIKNILAIAIQSPEAAEYWGAWISVETTLPEPGVRVDVWVDFREGYRETDIFYDGEVFVMASGSAIVSHWKPLSTPAIEALKEAQSDD